MNMQGSTGIQSGQTTQSGSNTSQISMAVQRDLNTVQNPNQGLQLMNNHYKKAKEYRDKAEELEKELEKQSKITLALAQTLQKNPNDNNTLVKLQESKSKTMNLLKTTKEYAKAVYDEAMYVQLAANMLNNKFQGAMGQNSQKIVQDTLKTWSGGATEKSFLFFNKNVMSASEISQRADSVVNANIGQSTQILSSIKGFS